MRLNTKTKFDAYPMPQIDKILDAVGQSQYITTTLDLAKGYWQILMEYRTKRRLLSPVFEKLQQTELTIKPKKCMFVMKNCVYLGHQIERGGV